MKSIRKIKPKPRFVLLAVVLLAGNFSRAQSTGTVSIDSCYTWARQNYPAIKQLDLIERSKEFSLENASKAYLPKLGVYGQATYQSDVTSIRISLPNVHINTLSKDQYKLYGEVVQPLSDLLVIKDHKELIENQAAAQKQKLEVDLYQLRKRIDQLYFGILLIDAQLQQTRLVLEDIQTGLNNVNAAVENGVAIPSQVDLLRANRLSIEQRIIELKSKRQEFGHVLGAFIDRSVDSSTHFNRPASLALNNQVTRPELQFFQTQKLSFDIQNRLITAKNLPHLSFFVQSGLGRPALNFLDNDFAGYYIGGLRLSWNLSGYYTSKNERQMLKVNQSILDVQEETFLFNLSMEQKQQNAEMTKYRSLLSTDDEIIALRRNIKQTTQKQLENGTATANDYLMEVHAEDQARQGRILHEIQLLMAQYNQATTTGYELQQEK